MWASQCGVLVEIFTAVMGEYGILFSFSLKVKTTNQSRDLVLWWFGNCSQQCCGTAARKRAEMRTCVTTLHLAGRGMNVRAAGCAVR